MHNSERHTRHAISHFPRIEQTHTHTSHTHIVHIHIQNIQANNKDKKYLDRTARETLHIDAGGPYAFFRNTYTHTHT